MNNEWKKEQERVDIIQEVLNQKLKSLYESMGEVKEGIVELRKTFWDDVTVNIDDFDERLESYISIRQQAELLSERERTHGHSNKQAKQLIRLKDSPYFGRIDFKEAAENEAEQIYIGISSLMDEENLQFLIYDWRAPISSLYYDYSPGPAQYLTPSGVIKGDMELKRQFIIKNGKVSGMFDTGVTIGDHLLQEVLGGNASTQMKSIVATIQKEQNHIIRNENSKYLIVQGVAGSGKTSAAMQRVAYLLYRYRNTLSADNIMLFSPNPLFNSYVATVLPELGEDNMEQTTYQQYLITRLSRQFKVENPFNQMEYTLTAMNDSDYQARMQAIRYKSSIEFKQRIDEYVNALSKQGLVFKSISFRGKVILSGKNISHYYYSLDSSISIPNRMKLTMDRILKFFSKYEKTERGKDWVIEEAELLDKAEYMEVFKQIQKEHEKVEETFDDADLELKYLSKTIVEKYFKPIIRAVKQYKFLNMKAIYSQFFQQYQNESSLFPEYWKVICAKTLKELQNNHLAYEDATPYLYLQDQLEGRKSNTKIRQLFIDEAQDYSPFQFEYLKQLYPHCKMTILGDVNQAIYAHSIDMPTILSYEFEGMEKVVLKRSYRSTKQIVDFTKGLIHGGQMIEPFNREGNKPVMKEVKDVESLHKNIAGCVLNIKSKGHETIAIICKTMKESKDAYRELKKIIQAHLIDPNANSYEKETVIIPAYLAKGIEFDAVIIYDASNQQYNREYERKLFYTACTRAMHELYLFSIGKQTLFLNDVDKDTYIKS